MIQPQLLINPNAKISRFQRLLTAPIGANNGIYSTQTHPTEPTTSDGCLTRRRIEPYLSMLSLSYKFRGRVHVYGRQQTRHRYSRKSPMYTTENYMKTKVPYSRLFSTKLLNFSVVKKLYLKHITLTPFTKSKSSRTRMRLSRKIRRHLSQYLFLNDSFSQDRFKSRTPGSGILNFFDILVTSVLKRVTTKRSKTLKTLISRKVNLLKVLRSVIQRQDSKQLRKIGRKGVALSHRRLTKTAKRVAWLISKEQRKPFKFKLRLRARNLLAKLDRITSRQLYILLFNHFGDDSTPTKSFLTERGVKVLTYNLKQRAKYRKHQVTYPNYRNNFTQEWWSGLSYYSSLRAASKDFTGIKFQANRVNNNKLFYSLLSNTSPDMWRNKPTNVG